MVWSNQFQLQFHYVAMSCLFQVRPQLETYQLVLSPINVQCFQQKYGRGREELTDQKREGGGGGGGEKDE